MLGKYGKMLGNNKNYHIISKVWRCKKYAYIFRIPDGNN